jgi:hypothetical protein
LFGGSSSGKLRIPECVQQRYCVELHHGVFALHRLLHLIHPALDDLRVLQDTTAAAARAQTKDTAAAAAKAQTKDTVPDCQQHMGPYSTCTTVVWRVYHRYEGGIVTSGYFHH